MLRGKARSRKYIFFFWYVGDVRVSFTSIPIVFVCSITMMVKRKNIIPRAVFLVYKKG